MIENNSIKIRMGELFGRIEEGFKNVNKRLDKIDEKLTIIEKNNTNLKLATQKNSLDIENLEKRFKNYVDYNKSEEKEKREIFYARAKLIFSILGLISGGWWIKTLIDYIAR